jgi:hypothetical protein
MSREALGLRRSLSPIALVGSTMWVEPSKRGVKGVCAGSERQSCVRLERGLRLRAAPRLWFAAGPWEHDLSGTGNMVRLKCCDTRRRKTPSRGNTNCGLAGSARKASTGLARGSGWKFFRPFRRGADVLAGLAPGIEKGVSDVLYQMSWVGDLHRILEGLRRQSRRLDPVPWQHIGTMRLRNWVL